MSLCYPYVLTAIFIMHTFCSNIDFVGITEWRRPMGCLIFISHYPHKSPIFVANLWKMTCNLRVDLNPSKKKSTKFQVRNVSIDFRTLFLNWYKIPLWFVFRTCFASAISVRPAGHAKVPADVSEDSRVLRARRLCTKRHDKVPEVVVISTLLVSFQRNVSKETQRT